MRTPEIRYADIEVTDKEMPNVITPTPETPRATQTPIQNKGA